MSRHIRTHIAYVHLGGKQIEVVHHPVPGAHDTILLLHEALGSVSYWRDFPKRLAAATGLNVLHYSRPGHGNSEGPLEERNEEHYLRQTESVIPALLDHYAVSRPILYGHSEGAGIAMLYTAASKAVKALILESPHVVPQRSTYLHIRKMAGAYQNSKLQERLALYHRNADAVFYAWVNWAARIPDGNYFPESLLAKIACPVLALQGQTDDFGTIAHMDALRAAIPNLEFELFANTGHLPHREQTELLLDRVTRFLTQPGHAVYQRESTISRISEEQL